MEKIEVKDRTIEYLLAKLDVKYGKMVRDVEEIRSMFDKFYDNELDDCEFTSAVGLLRCHQEDYRDLSYFTTEIINLMCSDADIERVELYRDAFNRHHLIKLNE